MDQERSEKLQIYIKVRYPAFLPEHTTPEVKEGTEKEDPGPCNFKEIIRRDRLLQTGRTDRILYVAMVREFLSDAARSFYQRKTSRKENDPLRRRRGMFRQK